MPDILHLTNVEIVISRQVSLGNDKYALSTVTAAMSNIQPQGRSSGSIADGVFGKQFKIYVDGAIDVQAGDRIRDENGTYYTVMADGATRRQFGTFDYKILLVMKTVEG